MNRLIASALVLAVALMAAPAMAQKNVPNPPDAVASVCRRMEQALINDSERRGHTEMIRALKDAKRIPLSVRENAPNCLEGSDWRVKFVSDERIDDALRFHVGEAIKAGVNLTQLLTPGEIKEFAPAKK